MVVEINATDNGEIEHLGRAVIEHHAARPVRHPCLYESAAADFAAEITQPLGLLVGKTDGLD